MQAHLGLALMLHYLFVVKALGAWGRQMFPLVMDSRQKQKTKLSHLLVGMSQWMNRK